MKIFLVPHTHWDREWYLPFNEYRLYLIRVLDRVVDGLENGLIDYFLLDGQVAAILDYLELRPQMKEKVKRLIADGKLDVGPWFTQPDEFLVSGEALIRNLIIGMSIAQKLGRCFSIGYLPDIFGHTPQLPQILLGLGIDTFLFSRGMDDEMPCEFVWEAPDGSKVISYFMKLGYCNGYFLGVERPYWKFLRVFKDPYSRVTAYYTYYEEEPEPDLDKAVKRIREIIEKMRECKKTQLYLIMNGCDHLPAQLKLKKLLEKIEEKIGAKIVVGKLKEFFDDIKKISNDLPIYKGEMRKCKYRPILADVLSTRIYLKQLNFKAQKLLEKYLEPLSVIVSKLGYEYPGTLIRNLWMKLLLNHAHDSICGTSVDEVHRENVARFQEVISAASNMFLQELYYLGNLTNEDGSKVIVFNPNNWDVTGLVEILILAHEEVGSVIGPDGSNIPVISREINDFIGDVKKIVFIAKDVPSIGYKVYRLSESKHSIREGIKIKGSEVETKFFRATIDINCGGALTLIDKRNGRKYEKLNIILDEGDVGDVYNYDKPDLDKEISSHNIKAQMSIVEGNAEYARVKVEYTMMIPRKSIDKKRSEETVPVKIEIYYTFYNEIPRIDVKTKIHNTALNHRMRAMFQVETISNETVSEIHFYDYHRDIEEKTYEDWVEVPPKVHPMHDYVGVIDKDGGLLIATRGLHEYSAKKEDNKLSLMITLLRSVGMLSKDNLKTRKGHAGPPIKVPEAQCLGEIELEYAIIPFVDFDDGVKRAKEFTQPLVGVIADKKGSLPPKLSFFKIKPDNIGLSAIKMSETGEYIVMRVFNRSAKSEKIDITSYFKIEKAWITNLKEEITKEIEILNQSIKYEIKPWKIETIAIKTKIGGE